MRTTLETYLTASGCTKIFYDSPVIANILTDEAGPDDIIAVIQEFDTMTLEPSGSGLIEHYTPKIDILKQCEPERFATNNETTITRLKFITKVFILILMRSGEFQKIGSVPMTRVNEKKYDANVIGWTLSLDLKLTEQSKCD